MPRVTVMARYRNKAHLLFLAPLVVLKKRFSPESKRLSVPMSLKAPHVRCESEQISSQYSNEMITGHACQVQ